MAWCFLQRVCPAKQPQQQRWEGENSPCHVMVDWKLINSPQQHIVRVSLSLPLLDVSFWEMDWRNFARRKYHCWIECSPSPGCIVSAEVTPHPQREPGCPARSVSSPRQHRPCTGPYQPSPASASSQGPAIHRAVTHWAAPHLPDSPWNP